MPKLDESLIAGLPPFQRLERAQIREILDQAIPKRHNEGSEVFREGHDADFFFLLLDGFVRVIRTLPTGEQVILRHIPPGQLIGIAPALSLQRGSWPHHRHLRTRPSPRLPR